MNLSRPKTQTPAGESRVLSDPNKSCLPFPLASCPKSTLTSRRAQYILRFLGLILSPDPTALPRPRRTPPARGEIWPSLLSPHTAVGAFLDRLQPCEPLFFPLVHTLFTRHAVDSCALHRQLLAPFRFIPLALAAVDLSMPWLATLVGPRSTCNAPSSSP